MLNSQQFEGRVINLVTDPTFTGLVTTFVGGVQTVTQIDPTMEVRLYGVTTDAGRFFIGNSKADGNPPDAIFSSCTGPNLIGGSACGPRSQLSARQGRIVLLSNP